MKRFDNFLKSKLLAWSMASLLAVLVAGCGGGGGGGDAAAAPGTLGVSLTDTPACGFDKVYVTVEKVRVHQSSEASDTAAGWTEIAVDPKLKKIDLLSLNNGVLFNLGDTTLPAGHYTQLRLVLDPNTPPGLANSVVLSGTTAEIALVTPSAVQSGIKLVNQFDVAAGQRVDLLLDFDACKSIVKRGNGTYALKPVIKVIPFEPNGIKGFVKTAAASCTNVMVTAQQNGAVIRSTAPLATGEFFLARLAPESYDVVLTADGCATAVIAAVPVASAPSVVNVSDVAGATPITLPVSVTSNSISGTATLKPENSDVVAYVAAKQTFGTAPIVTVKFVAADDLSSPLAGKYALTLPTGAPMFGKYLGALPVALVEQIDTVADPDVAGKYTLEASATGYKTQSPAGIIDIITTDAPNNDFTLGQ